MVLNSKKNKITTIELLLYNNQTKYNDEIQKNDF